VPPASHARALEIDGIRGWASFSVLLYHQFHEMLTALVPWINSSWLAPVFQGRLAVCVFFVLSGDALSTNFLARGGADISIIDRLLVRRYLRLTIPILMSCTLVFVLRLANVDLHRPAAAILQRTSWLGEDLDFNFSIISLLRYSLLGVYTSHTKAYSYNPFLWTMSLEMIGSMLVFLTCYLWPRLRQGRSTVAVLALCLFAMDSLFCLFFAGMFLGQLRLDSFFAKFEGNRVQQALWLAAFVALALILVATYNVKEKPIFFDMGVAVALVFVLYAQSGIRSFLRGRLSTWIGEISFPIYLVQFALIISFESWLVTLWSARQASLAWLPMIGLATVVATLFAASLFRWAEKTLLHHADRMVLQVLRRD
jgi:peptidoglycan/LPS O-acetylase OafA/YrhL